MLRKPTDRIKDVELREHLDFIQAEALGNIIELGAAPVAATPLLADNDVGRYNDIIYVRKGTKIYVITPGSTITVT